MTHKEQSKLLIDLFCQSEGIEVSDMIYRFGGNIARKLKGVRIDIMRECLCHYLYIHTNLTQWDISLMVGYKDRSTVAHAIVTVKNYLDNRDVLTLRYYDKLKKCARLMKFKEAA